MDKINKNSVALAGEFAVLSQLALRGYDANMTLGHTKSVDILISDPIKGKMYKLEVKSNFGGKPSRSKLFGYTLNWMMGEKHETISEPNLYYCFVNIEKQTNIFRFFIVASEVVAEYVKVQHKYWLDRKPGLSQKEIDIPMRQFRVGLEDNYSIPTPLAKDYENKWEFN
ncbi:MAG: hypothetical protein G01um10145_48 [Microgenomates group bacterium Gr01-1014_5]|nr:MAG: hypothetical protein G01um10145_48 [Microgenomates group bacterium Gr01-1014_5]